MVTRDSAVHAREHSLEVQLPFLQVVLGEFTALALATGDVTVDALAEVLDQTIGAPGVLGVISSDLSHYLDYESACRQDARTADAIAGLRPQNLARGQRVWPRCRSGCPAARPEAGMELPPARAGKLG